MTHLVRVMLAVALGGGVAYGVAPEEIDQAIRQLGSPDPQERREAVEQIGRIGLDAREALQRAADSPDPAIARAARSLLGTLPWYTQADPPEVRQHLEGYAAADIAGRRRIISGLSQVRSQSAGAALLRVLSEEPAAELRWRVVAVAVERPDLITGEALRGLEPRPQNVPMLAAIGWGWRQTDRERAKLLIRQAVELEAQAPSEDHNGYFAPWQWLCAAALVDGQPEEAAALCRLAAARDAALHPERESAAVRALFSLHARFGPLKTFEADLDRFAMRLHSAADLYIVAHCLRQRGAGLLGRALERAAFLQGANAPSERLQTAWVLSSGGWIEAAERELQALLDEPSLEAGLPGPPDEAYRATGQALLAYLAGMTGRDAVSAQRWEEAIPTLREFRDARLPGQAVEGDASVHAREQMLWRRLRAARTRAGVDEQAAGAEEVDRLVDELARSGTADADILHDLIPALQARGRAAEAQRLFEAAYAVVSVAYQQAPDSAEAMNNLAWLCARAGERLDEALRLSSRAVELEPDNAAYLDTLAEVHFRRGAAARSVELEMRALQLRPGDPFMLGQLKRYRAAAATQPAAPQ